MFADDLLFATLDPTLRGIDLPSGRRVILSDTVGFVSDLPTHLVAAFHATLEEVIEADILVHVRDIAQAETDAQKQDVIDVLKSLETPRDDQTMLEVLNKADLLSADERAAMHARQERDPGLDDAAATSPIGVSALTGEGLDVLLHRLDEILAEHDQTVTVQVPYHDGATVAWLHEHGDVLERSDGDGQAKFVVRLSGQDMGRLRKNQAITFTETAA